MLRITLLLLTATILLANTQPNAGTTGEKINHDSIVYLNKAIAFIHQIASKAVKDSSFVLVDKPITLDYFDCLKEVLNDKTTFTKNELQFIANNHYQISRWRKAHFPHIKLISSELIDSIFFKDFDKDWAYFQKEIGGEFHNFSSPIFLRNYTYCLFYSDTSCGSLCGSGQLVLYKLEGRKWKKVKFYCNWIS